MRRHATPYWLIGDGSYVGLQRIPFGEHDFSEAFLQETLHRNPDLLPVDEFDSSYGPLVSVGRELDGIDNLFIAPNGWLTLVETKLWRNPQSTREVVAQLLDYAARLAGTSYDDFEALCGRALTPIPIGGRSLYNLVSSAFPDETPPEGEFVDSVSRALRTGRFLLLIVGDGIREGLESMLGVLHTHPQMHFTFGLVEIHVYRHPNDPAARLLLPQVVANTTEIVRATVRVETTGVANVSVAFEPPEAAGGEPGSRRRLSEEEFLREVTDDRVRQMCERILEWGAERGTVTQWRASSVSIRLPDPRNGKQLFTLFVLPTTGAAYTGWLRWQIKRAGYDMGLADEYVARLVEAFPGCRQWVKDCPTCQELPVGDLIARVEVFMTIVEDLIERLRTEASSAT